jgi:hypothetical protein
VPASGREALTMTFLLTDYGCCDDECPQDCDDACC